MVIILLGSASDLSLGKEIGRYLKDFGISFRIHIGSAHKTPQYLMDILKKYEEIQQPLVYICVAGRSNALGGFVDSQTSFPVINCPPYCEKFAGLDILSSLRMPSGVSALTVLEPQQAALAAMKILAFTNKDLRKIITKFQGKSKEIIINKDKELNKSI